MISQIKLISLIRVRTKGKSKKGPAVTEEYQKEKCKYLKLISKI